MVELLAAPSFVKTAPRNLMISTMRLANKLISSPQNLLKPPSLVHTGGNCHKGGEWVQGSQRRPRALRPADQEHRASRGMFAAPDAAMRATCRTDTRSQSPDPSCSLAPNVSPPPPAPNVPPPRHTVHEFGCPFCGVRPSIGSLTPSYSPCGRQTFLWHSLRGRRPGESGSPPYGNGGEGHPAHSTALGARIQQPT